MAAPRRPIKERFEEKYIPEPNSGCWLWLGPTSRTNKMVYGTIGIGRGRTYKAHRISWTLHNGDIPAGIFVLHRCDNPLCVNPQHLFLGTHADNMADMAKKGRARTGPKEKKARGESIWKSKILEGDIREIFKLYRGGEKSKNIAKKFGISQNQILCILRRQYWAHVEV